MRVGVRCCIVSLSLVAPACGDDVVAVSEGCGFTTEVRLLAGLDDRLDGSLVVSRAGDRLFFILGDAGIVPDPRYGQVHVTDLCGGDPVRIAEGEVSYYLRPMRIGEDVTDDDPSLVCIASPPSYAAGSYRIDLTGRTPPQPMLAGWSCGVGDPPWDIAWFDDGDKKEVWRVPNYPDLAGSRRILADADGLVGIGDPGDSGAYFHFRLDDDGTLHVVDEDTGVDEVVVTDVVRTSGMTHTQDERRSVRIMLVRAVPGEPEAVYLYRHDTREAVKLGDVRPTDTPAPKYGGWAWSFHTVEDDTLVILREPFFDEVNFIEVFDLDGRPLAFPEGITSAHWRFDGGVLGAVYDSVGYHWVIARPGSTEPITLDVPHEPYFFRVIKDDYLLYEYYDDEREEIRTFKVPLDGAPAVELPALAYPYSDHDAFALAGDRLVHVDWQTGQYETIAEGVGDVFHLDETLYYSVTTPPERAGVWALPVSLLPRLEP